MSLSVWSRAAWRVGWRSAAFVVLLFGLALGAARLWAPDVNPYRQQIADWASGQVKRPVRIEHAALSWRGLRPVVRLDGVTVMAASGSTPLLRVARLQVGLDLWASLLAGWPQPDDLALQGAEVTLKRQADGRIVVAGLPALSAAGSQHALRRVRQWLRRHDRLSVLDSTVHWEDEASDGAGAFTHLRAVLINGYGRHRVQASAIFSGALGARLSLQADLRGDLLEPDRWVGTVNGQGKALRLSAFPRPAGWPHGMLGGVVDADLKSRWDTGLDGVTGWVRGAGLQWRVNGADPARSLEPARVWGHLVWRRQARGGVLEMDPMQIAVGSTVWPATRLHLRWQPLSPSGEEVFELNYGYARLEDVLAVAAHTPWLNAGAQTALSQAAPRAVLLGSQLFFYPSTAEAGRTRWLFDTAFHAFTTRPFRAWPGIQGLAGHFSTDGERGAVQFAGQDLNVDFPDHLFRTRGMAAALGGQVQWHPEDGDLVVTGTHLFVRNADLRAQGDLYGRWLAGEASPYVDLNLRFESGNVQRLVRYVPAKVPAKAVAWLDRALVGGALSAGTAKLRGRLADFPYTHSGGEFEVHFKVTGGVLDYAPGWPRLENLQADVGFVGRSLQVDATAGRILDTAILRTHAEVPDLGAKPVVVRLQGRAQGPAADALRILRDSPLKTRFGDAVGGLAARGNSGLQLSLRLPVGQPAQVQGQLALQDVQVWLKSPGLDFSQINGTLGFNQSGLEARGIQADLLGQPATVSIQTTLTPAGTETAFEATGRAEAAAVARRYAAFLAPYLAGRADWQARWVWSRTQVPLLTVRSNLEGVAVRLPEPFAKPAAERVPLLVEVPLPLQPDRPLHLVYGTQVQARLAFVSTGAGTEIDRGEVHLGEGDARLPGQPGVRITGTVPRIVQADWGPLLRPRPSGSGPGEAWTSGVTAVDLDVDQLWALDRVWNRLHIQAVRAGAAWTADLNGADVAGRLSLPDDPNATVTATLDTLAWPPKHGAEAGPQPDPRTLSPLTLSVKRFQYGTLALGQLELHTEHRPYGLALTQLTLHAPPYRLQMQGEWHAEGARPQTTFHVQLDSQDVGRSLAAFGYADMIKGGTAQMTLQARWPGWPGASLTRLSGSLSLKIKKGRLLDVEPGAGRILGLISFQALPRRLSLDFSDVFSKGFTFDQIAGDFRIEDGNAFTDNLRMDGPTARIEARGRVGLAAQDYDEQVTVTPNVSGGLPWVGALAAGPAGAAATWLAGKVIGPEINGIARVKYRVHGSWTQPVIERETSLPGKKSSR